MAAQDPPEQSETQQQRDAEPVRGETMESFAQAIFAAPPKKDWRYLNNKR